VSVVSWITDSCYGDSFSSGGSADVA